MASESDIPHDETPVAEAAHGSAVGRWLEALIIRGLGMLEHLFLITVAGMTVVVAGLDILKMVEMREVTLADLLLMFLYTEVIGMVAVFYSGKGSPFIYPILIAITALARLMVIQGKELTPDTIVYQAAAVLLLALSAVVVARLARK